MPVPSLVLFTSLSCAASGPDPACADPLANVPGEVKLPAGVSVDPRSREQVIASAESWDRPAGLTFRLVGSPTVAGDRATLRAELANTTEASQIVLLSEAGAGFFHATRVGDGLVRRPVPPPDPGLPPRPALFPEPRAYVLAPGARWTVETSVVLSCWEEHPGPVTLHWWFNVEDEDLQGEVTVAR